LAVSDDDDEVGRIALQESLDFKGADLIGLMDGDFCSKSDFFYGGGRNLAAAAACAIRLGDDGEEFEVGLREEVLEGGDGELRSATEE
jgi:hypothetical protein